MKKDLTFIHLGNDSKVEGLINFEKLRMIAKEVRTLTNMCSAPYDLLTMLELGKIFCFRQSKDPRKNCYRLFSPTYLYLSKLNVGNIEVFKENIILIIIF